MQTFGASLGSVCRRNSDNLNPRKPTLVFKEAAELGKRPRVGSASERLVAFLLVSAFANVGQVLNGYALALVLCLLNNLSADSMIDNGSETVKYLNVYRLTQQKATVQFLPETEDFGVFLNHIL